MKELKGKCGYYFYKGLCLGCMQLALKEFEGDDDCPYIKEREDYESWRIR